MACVFQHTVTEVSSGLFTTLKPFIFDPSCDLSKELRSTAGVEVNRTNNDGTEKIIISGNFTDTVIAHKIIFTFLNQLSEKINSAIGKQTEAIEQNVLQEYEIGNLSSISNFGGICKYNQNNPLESDEKVSTTDEVLKTIHNSSTEKTQLNNTISDEIDSHANDHNNLGQNIKKEYCSKNETLILECEVDNDSANKAQNKVISHDNYSRNTAVVMTKNNSNNQSTLTNAIQTEEDVCQSAVNQACTENNAFTISHYNLRQVSLKLPVVDTENQDDSDNDMNVESPSMFDGFVSDEDYNPSDESHNTIDDEENIKEEESLIEGKNQNTYKCDDLLNEADMNTSNGKQIVLRGKELETDKDIDKKHHGQKSREQNLKKDHKKSEKNLKIDDKKDYVEHSPALVEEVYFKGRLLGKCLKDEENQAVAKSVCFFCDYTNFLLYPRSVRQLKQHYNRCHVQPDLKYQCELCNKRFGWLSEFNMHKSMHMKKKCKICGIMFNKRRFFMHARRHNPEYDPYRFQCNICQKKLTTKNGLRNHLTAIHNSEDRILFPCTKCDKFLTTKASLETHLRNVHGTKQEKEARKTHFCETCKKGFVSASKLREHKQVHNIDVKYICSVCGKEFQSKPGLKLHVRSIHDESSEKFLCSECGRSFTQSHSLTRHMRTHTGERPFSCDLCSDTFNDSSILRRHLMLKHKKSKNK